MAGNKPGDKVQREIEELLDKLDNFVPEERFASKIRARRKQQREETRGPSAWSQFTGRLSRMSLGQVMLAGLGCLVVAFLFRGALGGAAMWLTIAGLVMTAGAFILSVVTGGGTRATVGQGRVQKRWRGQIIEYSEPSTMDRLRAWFRRRGR